MTILFKVTTEYQYHSLANESVNFVDVDSEEDECTEKGGPKKIKQKVITELQPANSEIFGVAEDCVEEERTSKITYKSTETEQMSQPSKQKNPGTVKSSKSVMGKVLGKMQQLSSRFTSSLKERFVVAGSGTVYSKLPPSKLQSNVNRSRSDSTINSLKKKEQIDKPPKRSFKESSNFFNAVQSPQMKQKQAVNAGRVSKPPKPLPKMFRNKKNLLTGKENKP